MNNDVSGIGVRISFYLQTLLLGETSTGTEVVASWLTDLLPACLSARSGSPDEITGALYTLIATNMAMAITALILGLRPEPEITFHE